MRAIIAGSRTINEKDVREALGRCLWAGFISAVVSGTARGADEFGEKWARENNIKINHFPADWEKFGKRAGPLRNKEMAENAEGLIAIWDGQSRGTYSMIELAKRRGLRISVLRTDNRRTEEYAASGELAAIWESAEERAAIKEHDAGVPRAKAEHDAGAEILQQVIANS